MNEAERGWRRLKPRLWLPSPPSRAGEYLREVGAGRLRNASPRFQPTG